MLVSLLFHLCVMLYLSCIMLVSLLFHVCVVLFLSCIMLVYVLSWFNLSMFELIHTLTFDKQISRRLDILFQLSMI
jgi:hypothetical protein